MRQQHQILPTRLSNLKKNTKCPRLFQPTCLLESWELSIESLAYNCMYHSAKWAVS